MGISPKTQTGFEPLLVDAKGVCVLLGVGLSCLYAMDRSGELGPMGIRLRRRRLWPRKELAAGLGSWIPHNCILNLC